MTLSKRKNQANKTPKKQNQNMTNYSYLINILPEILWEHVRNLGLERSVVEIF